MLEVYKILLSELEKSEVMYCSWKSNHNLEHFLEGHGDLDLYVPFENRSDFEEICKKCGFINFKSRINAFPFVKHYMCFDSNSNAFAHIHVYYKFVTGESNSKNYIIPFENWIDNNLISNDSLPVPNYEAQFIIFITRYFLKFGTIQGLALLYRDKNKYIEEWNGICKYLCTSNIDTPSWVSIDELMKMKYLYEKGSFWQKFLYSLMFKHKMRGYARKNILEMFMFKTVNTILRLFNKLAIKNNKSLESGLIISVCGLDGSGKSTAVEMITELYKRKGIAVKKVHIGRPLPTLLTFPFWVLVRVAERLKRRPQKVGKSVEDYIPSSDIGVAAAVRYTILANQRYVAFKRAQRLASKGYLVVTDRYPSHNYCKMDSPRIISCPSKGAIYQSLHRLEKTYYSYILPSDVAFFLNVTQETSIYRNNIRVKSMKETDNEIIARHKVNVGIEFKANKVLTIDASKPIVDVHRKILSQLWINIIKVQ